jgi:hypothetical protein
MINVTNYFDQAILNEMIAEQMKQLETVQPWIRGILKKKLEPKPVVRLASMVEQKRSMMPHVAVGNDPVELAKAKLKTKEADMTHFFVKKSLNEDDVLQLQDTIDMIFKSDMKTDDAYRVANNYLLNVRADILKMYTDAQVFMICQLLTNPQGVKIDGSIHDDPFTHFQAGINDETETLANFNTNPYDVIERCILAPAAAKGVTLSHILIGSEVATKFKNSQYVQNMKMILATSLFNYKPINMEFEVAANGVKKLTEIGGIPVLVAANIVKENGVDVDAFDPRAIVGIKQDGLGTIHTAPTVRFNPNVVDTSEFSFYEYTENNRDKNITYKSEGYYLVGLDNPEKIFRLTLTGWGA